MTGFITNAPFVGDLDNYFLKTSDILDSYSQGEVFAWGYNASGSIGDGTTINRSSPVLLPSSGFTEVEIAYYGNASVGDPVLALHRDGTLYGWGYAQGGTLGNNTIIARSSPIQISTSTYKSIGSGFARHFAITSSGDLFGWGSNGSTNRLGDGTTINRSTPTLISAANGVPWSYIKDFVNSTVALKVDGSLWVWGSNSSGQFGDGTTINRSFPTQVGSDTNWLMATAGADNVIALKRDGTLWAWGNNASGRLGISSTGDRSSPVQIGTENTWIYAHAGYHAVTAIKSNGTLWTWGFNNFGVIGDGTVQNKSSPTQIGSGTDWKYVTSNGLTDSALPGSSATVFAIKKDGSLFWWGGSLAGVGGTGGTVYRSSPVQLFPDKQWRKVIIGNHSAVGITI